MFTLKIHTNSIPECITTVVPATASAYELRGVAHLLEDLPRTLQIFVPAMPDVFTPNDFLSFCESYVAKFSDICFIRNKEEGRCSVLITLKEERSAHEFYMKFNGKNFMDSEDVVFLCNMYFIRSTKYTRSTEPQPGFHELPTCPICLERLGYNTSGKRSTLCDHSFPCSCVPKWTDLSCQACQLCQQQDKELACVVCGTSVNPRVCLICGVVACGSHAINHWDEKKHRFALEVWGKKIWDYYGDVYISRPNQPKVDGSSECNSVDEIMAEYTRRLASDSEMWKKRDQELAEKSKLDTLQVIESEKNALYNMNEELRKRNEELMKRNEELMTKLKALANLNRQILERERLAKEINLKKTEAAMLREEKKNDKKIEELQDQIATLRAQVKDD